MKSLLKLSLLLTLGIYSQVYAQVGIGTTNPGNSLTVVGNMAIGDSTFGVSPAPDSSLVVQGQVGIGTNTPAAGMALDVNGPATISGDLVVTGNIVGGGGLPPGMITMFGGSLNDFDATGLGSGQYAGWALCNGQNGTADLRGRFIVGFDDGNSAYSTLGITGGDSTVTLTTAQMPAHTHNIAHSHRARDNGHLHYFNTIGANINVNGAGGIGIIASGGTNGTSVHSSSYSDNQVDVENFSGGSGQSGSNQAHENRPPYYVLAYIQRL